MVGFKKNYASGAMNFATHFVFWEEQKARAVLSVDFIHPYFLKCYTQKSPTLHFQLHMLMMVGG